MGQWHETSHMHACLMGQQQETSHMHACLMEQWHETSYMCRYHGGMISIRGQQRTRECEKIFGTFT